VVSLLTEIEDQLGIVLEDDEIDGDLLETFGSLRDFLSAKRTGS
jgi:acyl carrier protein